MDDSPFNEGLVEMFMQTSGFSKEEAELYILLEIEGHSPSSVASDVHPYFQDITEEEAEETSEELRQKAQLPEIKFVGRVPAFNRGDKEVGGGIEIAFKDGSFLKVFWDTKYEGHKMSLHVCEGELLDVISLGNLNQSIEKYIIKFMSTYTQDLRENPPEAMDVIPEIFDMLAAKNPNEPDPANQ